MSTITNYWTRKIKAYYIKIRVSIFRKHILIRKSDYDLGRYKYGFYDANSHNTSKDYTPVNVLFNYTNVRHIFLVITMYYLLICGRGILIKCVNCLAI